MKLPDVYLPVMPYLIIKDVAMFARFMEKIFHAKLRYPAPRPEGLIMHGELQIEDAVVMFVDATKEYLPRPAGAFLYVENADAIFNRAIEAGAPVLTELADRNHGYGVGFGYEWGNQWWVNTPPVSK